jgi:hypothetical protein
MELSFQEEREIAEDFLKEIEVLRELRSLFLW